MDSTDPQTQSQPRASAQNQHQSQEQQQAHRVHNHHHPHNQRPAPAGPTDPQQQPHIQPQTQNPQIHPVQHQHPSYAHQTMQYQNYTHHYTRHPYSQPFTTYSPNVSYGYPPHQYSWQTQTFAAGPVVAPTSTDMTSTRQVSLPRTPRQRQVASVKDPVTGKPIDLGEKSPDSSKSTSAKTSSTQPTTTSATTTGSTLASTTAAAALKKNNPITTANTNNVTNSVTMSSSEKANSPPQPIHTLLQKVSEDTSSDNRKAGTTNSTTVTAPTSATRTLEVQTTTTTKPIDTTTPTANAPVTLAAPPSPAKNVKEAQGQEKIEQNTSSPSPSEAGAANKVETKTNNINGKDEDKPDPESKSCESDSKDPSSDANEVKKDVEEGSDGGGTKENDSTKEGETEKDEAIELHYEPGQYNPLSNRDGKKKYTRDFLIEVCEKICKLNVFDDEKEDKSMDNCSLNSHYDPFVPLYSKNRGTYVQANRQNDQLRRQNHQNYMGRSSAGQEKQRKVISSSSLTNEVELKTVSNPWRPGKEVKEDVPIDVVEVEALKKKFRSILNKLTPNNFDSLSAAVTNLNIDTAIKLGEVIDIVFAKALAEPGYCTLYGQMCSHLKKITAGTTNFGNTLLKRCQNQFQSDIYSGLNIDERKKKIDDEESADVKKQLNEELYEDMFRCRMRGLGLIKFIGELYKIEMLNDEIMFDCILRLLSDTSEESLECLCDLLVTIGEKLDRSSQKSAKEERKTQRGPSKANAYQSGKSAASVVASGAQQKAAVTTLDDIFDQLHKIRKNKELPVSLRIRFKLLDVCELREKDNWHSKKRDNNPKKIDEIREAHKDAERRKDAIGPRRSQEGRRGLGHSSGSSSQISSLANESGVMRGGAIHASASSHSIRDHSLGDNKKQNNSDAYELYHQSTKAVINILKKDLSNQSDRSLGPPMTLRPHTNSGRVGSSSLTSGGLRPTTGAGASAAAAVAAATSAASNTQTPAIERSAQSENASTTNCK